MIDAPRTPRCPVPAIDVLHLIDTLEIGGAERMAVNLVNRLPRDRFRAHLCTTRAEGPLAKDIQPEIPRLRLGRKWRFDPLAVRKLVHYVHSNDIRILHAHGSALFLAQVVAAMAPTVRVIWHNHYGFVGSVDRPAWIYRLAVRNVVAVISVNAALAGWARSRLHVPTNRVWQLNNFTVPAQRKAAVPKLPGLPHLRVVCVANLRPVKGHRDLLTAIASVRERVPGLHLLLVGAAPDPAHRAVLEEDIRRLGIGAAVSFLGQREDVEAILRQCSVAVLSSHHEGLPVALLEYGHAGLAVVATDAGECAEVLDGGRCGLVVGARQASALGSAIERLLTDQTLRTQLAARFRDRVEIHYSESEAIRQLCCIYETAFSQRRKAPVQSPHRSLLEDYG